MFVRKAPKFYIATCHDPATPISLGASLFGEDVGVNVCVCHLKTTETA
jgi:hypothetical protein